MADDNLTRHGITTENVKLLHLLSDAEGKSLPQKELESTLDVRRSSVTSMLQTLERRGIIVRTTREGGREKTVSLTEEGKRLEDELGEFIETMHRNVFRSFTAVELEEFAGYLRRAIENTIELDGECGFGGERECENRDKRGRAHSAPGDIDVKGKDE